MIAGGGVEYADAKEGGADQQVDDVEHVMHRAGTVPVYAFRA
jgi:hypothetical protein